jgi:hypothetical protein
MDMTFGLIVCEVMMLVIGSVFSQIFKSVIDDVNWTPSAIFAGAEPGVWFDPSDLSTLFQDSAGTTPVTAVGQTVGRILDKSGRGNHATQATLAQRPTYQIDSTGRPYLSFDGVDDGMVTGTITPATNKVQVFAGLQKLTNLVGVVYETSVAAFSTAGSICAFSGFNGAVAGAYWSVCSHGNAPLVIATTGATFAAPNTAVVTQIADIAAPTNTLRVNAAQQAAVTTTQGTGNYLAYPLYIGRRAGASLPFNGRIYSMIVRFGPNLTTNQITSAETYVNEKTGAY